MNTYLFAWNPTKWEWTDLQNLIAQLPRTKPIQPWETMRKKDIGMGDKFILVKLGTTNPKDKGIIGIGHIVSDVYQDENWVENSKDYANFVKLEFEQLSEQPLIDLVTLESHYSKINWTPQGNGNHIDESIADEILKKLSFNSIDEEQEAEMMIRNDSNLSITEKEQLIKARKGQGKFREDLLKYWSYKCCVTDVDLSDILVASHIKAWKDSDNSERLDVYNGLLLSPTLDKLFDKGFISFSDKGYILFSERVKPYIEVLGLNEKMRINLQKEHLKYLAFHRSMYGFVSRSSK